MEVWTLSTLILAWLRLKAQMRHHAQNDISITGSDMNTAISMIFYHFWSVWEFLLKPARFDDSQLYSQAIHCIQEDVWRWLIAFSNSSIGPRTESLRTILYSITFMISFLTKWMVKFFSLSSTQSRRPERMGANRRGAVSWRANHARLQ